MHEEIPPQEIFQLAKDFQAARQHQKNASRYETKKVVYVPVVNEIVDHFRAIDPESKSSKKLAFFWDGPMAVTKINEGRKTVELQKIDPITMQKERKVKRVHCHYLRPSLIWNLPIDSNHMRKLLSKIEKKIDQHDLAILCYKGQRN